MAQIGGQLQKTCSSAFKLVQHHWCLQQLPSKRCFFWSTIWDAITMAVIYLCANGYLAGQFVTLCPLLLAVCIAAIYVPSYSVGCICPYWVLAVDSSLSLSLCVCVCVVQRPRCKVVFSLHSINRSCCFALPRARQSFVLLALFAKIEYEVRLSHMQASNIGTFLTFPTHKPCLAASAAAGCHINGKGLFLCHIS